MEDGDFTMEEIAMNIIHNAVNSYRMRKNEKDKIETDYVCSEDVWGIFGDEPEKARKYMSLYHKLKNSTT